MNKAVGFAAQPKCRYRRVCQEVLRWLVAMHPPSGGAEFLLDGLESLLSLVPKKHLGPVQPESMIERHMGLPVVRWRNYESAVPEWQRLIRTFAPGFTPAQSVRLYRLLRWADEPAPEVPRQRPDLECLMQAFAAGGAAEADLYDHLLGPRPVGGRFLDVGDLRRLVSLNPNKDLERWPVLKPIVERCRAKVLEIEVRRGEMPTPVSGFAVHLEHSGGLATLVRLLQAAEKDTFHRAVAWGNFSKKVVFSHLIQHTYPGEGETPDRFGAAVREAAIPEDRRLQLAVYAPQWSSHVEQAVGWPELAEAVWWIHAHTKDRRYFAGDLREAWKAQVAQRTPLSADDLLDGAVDVEWFHRVHRALSNARWQALYDVARFASQGVGHKRAMLFADAMLARTRAEALVERINVKRHQDAVRALGLVPLGKGQAAAKEVADRYHVMQEFIRTSRRFGSQRQASEKRAAAIGMENLARTAGYPDPIRLQWAMETRACADLAKGPVTVSADGVEVSLAIDEAGQPGIAVTRAGKPLRSVPAAVRKKHPEIKDLLDRRADLKRSAFRMRTSLEEAMIRGDAFSGAELGGLMDNPLLAPMLERLVFLGEGIAGYPVDGGRGLENHAGTIEPLKKGEALRLAHPHDLLAGEQWHEWQKHCFVIERIQPFKQVFRELYVVTPAEQQGGEVSRRYAGHQVQPRQALALLGRRGWVVSPEEGAVLRAFHREGLVAHLTFQEAFYTPAEIEGLTLEGVRFLNRKAPDRRIGLEDVPPRLFSEVMRDLDLVVSVAHRGGVDPEASASTVEMRAALLTQMTQLLSLDNVRLKGARALIAGRLGEYSVHLGSAVAHRMGGQALYIVAVHSQHRGRLFLPFADDDPKTAEVLSKVLLLARDHEIKDPSILQQIQQ